MSTTHRIGGVTVTVSSRGAGNGKRVEVLSSGTFSLDAVELFDLSRLLRRLAVEFDPAHATRCRCGRACQPWLSAPGGAS